MHCGLLTKQTGAKTRSIAGEAGFDLGFIPTARNPDRYRDRGPVEGGIDGQWANWNDERGKRVLPKLAAALVTSMGSIGESEVNKAILSTGFRFESGGFVPVNARAK